MVISSETANAIILSCTIVGLLYAMWNAWVLKRINISEKKQVKL